jgi:hypothetical protein
MPTAPIDTQVGFRALAQDDLVDARTVVAVAQVVRPAWSLTTADARQDHRRERLGQVEAPEAVREDERLAARVCTGRELDGRAEARPGLGQLATYSGSARSRAWSSQKALLRLTALPSARDEELRPRLGCGEDPQQRWRDPRQRS